MTFPMPTFMPAVGGPILTYVDTANDTAISSSYSFASVGLGTAAADRYIVVAANTRKGDADPDITSVTVAGVSATEVVQSAGTRGRSGLWIAAVPTGTSDTVVVATSTNGRGCTIFVYTLTGLTSSTATSTNSNSGSASSLGASLTASAGGIIIATACSLNNTDISWTNAVEDLEYDQTAATANTSAAASAIGLSAGAITVTATFSTSQTVTLAAAHWL